MSKMFNLVKLLATSKKFLKLSVVLLSILTLLLSQSGSAIATSISHSKVVSANPANFTPNVNQGAVYKLHQVGNTMFAGGTFQTVTHGATTYNRANFLAFNADTGAVSTFAPRFDAPVWSITSLGNNLYVGGDFKTVNGLAMRGIAKFDITTGKLDPTFKSPIAWGKVTEVGIARNKLILGGSFPEKLMAADLNTGKNTNYFNFKVTGSVTNDPNDTKIYRFAINPAGNRLVAVGNFTKFNSKVRHRAVMINMAADASAVNAWYYKPLEDDCRGGKMSQLRDVDFSPDGSYFVIVSSGWVAKEGRIGISLCDVAARFNTTVTNPTRPVWMQHTGGDTMHSVAIAGSVIYLQGHFRRLDNPHSIDGVGPGSVARPGIGAVDPTTGKALPWNPTKQRGEGGRDTLITPKGVWIASDTDIVANEWRKRIAFFPL